MSAGAGAGTSGGVEVEDSAVTAGAWRDGRVMTHARIAERITMAAANPRRTAVLDELATAGGATFVGVASVTGSDGGGGGTFGISARTGAAPDGVATGGTAMELGAAVATSSGGTADNSAVSSGKFARPRRNASRKVGAL